MKGLWVTSIIRQDLTTKDWTVFSVKRADRPHDYREKEKKKELKKYEPGCPFCLGNEEETPDPLLVINGGENWSVRVVKNKFPAVEAIDSLGGGSCERKHGEGPYLSVDGIGEHEVIIESPFHYDNLVKMDIGHVGKVMTACRRRFIDVSGQFKNQVVIIFKNHGKKAGTSLDHPHSQLVAIPFVPEYIRNKMFESQRYYEDLGRCVYCEIIQHELKSGKRLIHENEKYIAITPYASVVPYNIIIYPKKHMACFAQVSEGDLTGLAGILQIVLGKLYRLLDDPDYNFVIDTSPIEQSGNSFYHWHLEILPRLSTRAGFEIGSGMNINHIMPETCAKKLRATKFK